MTRNEGLQQLLLSTGHAILIDTVEGDASWTCAVDEFELQHLLGKQYVSAGTVIDWITQRVKPPSTLSHLVVRLFVFGKILQPHDFSFHFAASLMSFNTKTNKFWN